MRATPAGADGTRRLRACLRALRLELADATEGLDRARPQQLHRTRVVARRLRSIVAVYATFIGPDRGRPARAALRTLADAVNGCRDCDVRAVLLLRLSAAPDPLPVADRRRLRTMLRRERAVLTESLVASLSDDAVRRDAIDAVQALRVRDGVPARALVAEVRLARRRLRRRARASGSRRQVHRLRLAVKRLRYALAPLDDHRSDEVRRLLGHLQEAQAGLGECHDARVAIDWVRAHRGLLGRAASDELLRRLRDHARASRRDARSALCQAGPAWKAWRRAARGLRPGPSGRRGRA